MDERTFTHVGTSVLNGKLTYRFANGDMDKRTKVLLDNGHTDVKWQPWPLTLTKALGIAYLNSKGIYATDDAAAKHVPTKSTANHMTA